MPSTYSPSLKIELIAVGEETNQWGPITNNNFQYALEEAITGYATATFPSDADYNWAATYVNSNASQAARNLVIQVLGTLTQTRTLTVPTLEKEYVIYNATVGAQAITVRTALGSGVTIPNAQRMHVYVDGTNVVQMDNYDVSRTIGSLTLTSALPVASGGTGAVDAANARTNLGLVIGTDIPSPTGTGASGTWAIDISGNAATATTATNVSGGTADVTALTLTGFTQNYVPYVGALGVITESSNLQFNGTALTVSSIKVWRGGLNNPNNFGVGENTLQNNNGGNYNVAVGPYASQQNTVGSGITAVGWSAALASQGSGTTSVGYRAGSDAGGATVAVGFDAAQNVIGPNNTVVGTEALSPGGLTSNNTATNNTLVGYRSGYATTTGSSNVGVGYETLISNLTGNEHVAIGFQALLNNVTDSGNVAVGTWALRSLNSGSNNTAIGWQAGNNHVNGSNNIFIGKDANTSTSASNEIVIGNSANNKLTIPGLSYTGGPKYLNLGTSSVASLPIASTAGAGARAFVIDASSPTFGAMVVGGGTVSVPVYSDGINWFVG
jgi:hypothetical protein